MSTIDHESLYEILNWKYDGVNTPTTAEPPTLAWDDEGLCAPTDWNFPTTPIDYADNYHSQEWAPIPWAPFENPPVFFENFDHHSKSLLPEQPSNDRHWHAPPTQEYLAYHEELQKHI